MDQLSGFWIIGIAVNVILTVLAIVWVIRQMRPSALDGNANLPPRSHATADTDNKSDAN